MQIMSVELSLNVGVKERNLATSSVLHMQCPWLSADLHPDKTMLLGVYWESGAKVMEIKVAEINAPLINNAEINVILTRIFKIRVNFMTRQFPIIRYSFPLLRSLNAFKVSIPPHTNTFEISFNSKSYKIQIKIIYKPIVENKRDIYRQIFKFECSSPLTRGIELVAYTYAPLGSLLTV